MEHKIICLHCPRGCQVQASTDKTGSIISLTGNLCPQGDEYTAREILHPVRILCTSVQVQGGSYPLVPVWTPQAVPRELLMELSRVLHSMVLQAPVEFGQVLLENWQGLGIRVETSASVPLAGKKEL